MEDIMVLFKDREDRHVLPLPAFFQKTHQFIQENGDAREPGLKSRVEQCRELFHETLKLFYILETQPREYILHVELGTLDPLDRKLGIAFCVEVAPLRF